MHTKSMTSPWKQSAAVSDKQNTMMNIKNPTTEITKPDEIILTHPFKNYLLKDITISSNIKTTVQTNQKFINNFTKNHTTLGNIAGFSCF